MNTNNKLIIEIQLNKNFPFFKVMLRRKNNLSTDLFVEKPRLTRILYQIMHFRHLCINFIHRFFIRRVYLLCSENYLEKGLT